MTLHATVAELEKEVERLRRIIADLIEEGDTARYGGRPAGTPRFDYPYIQPTSNGPAGG